MRAGTCCTCPPPLRLPQVPPPRSASPLQGASAATALTLSPEGVTPRVPSVLAPGSYDVKQ
ncbi:hypothetical protein [Vitiosangium sp. GDMCC 1.1324]|uniref:hypothetical protein n=1 Tax=Vitiosangium sp. (strain GDMCC 1.1324) TaxID=2138576 RepID=UPI0011B73842|nr:hypothetical protein [Vitiosangium sp. GDMCC 1.1324]